MGGPAARHMFGRFEYQKTVEEILAASSKKIEAVKAKISEREGRIARIRKEFDITDAELVSLFAQAANEAGNRYANSMSYNIPSATGEAKVIAAGVVQNLLTEQNLMEQEKDSATKLAMVVRNLRPVTHYADNGVAYTVNTFNLTEDEIEYLGF
jgi:hypothetical protein